MSSNLPIYNATKSAFESLESQIDIAITEIVQERERIIRNAQNWTDEQLEKAKASLKKKVNDLIAKFQNKANEQTKALSDKQSKLAKIKELIDAVKSSPTIDTIVSWANSVINIFKEVGDLIESEIEDITTTTAYLATATTKIASKLAELASLGTL